MAITNAQLRDDFIEQLNFACEGLRAATLASGAGLAATDKRHYGILTKMTELNLVEKVEGLFYLTDYGKTKVKSNTREAIDSKPVTQEQANEKISEFLSTEEVDAHIGNMDAVRSILVKATQDIIARLKRTLPIGDREAKVLKLREVAGQLNADNATLLNEVADYIEAI